MRIVFAFAAALVAGTSASSVFAQAQPQEPSQPTTTPDTTGTSSASSGSEVVCRPMYHNGMVISTQACHTKREWEAMRLRNQNEISQTQLRALTSQPH
jgi:hypothetical protein